MKKCPDCGFVEDGKYCSMCGALLEDIAMKKEFTNCPNCGKEILSDSNICSYCGHTTENKSSKSININKRTGYDESVTNIDQSRTDSSAKVGGNIVVSPTFTFAEKEPSSKTKAADGFCDICGMKAGDQYFVCKKCGRKYLCLKHFNEEFYCCEICVKQFSDRDDVESIKELPRVMLSRLSN